MKRGFSLSSFQSVVKPASFTSRKPVLETLFVIDLASVSLLGIVCAGVDGSAG